ncbi:hypothetical protein BGZ79_005809, partial [Entomortierella chlamydospora]
RIRVLTTSGAMIDGNSKNPSAHQQHDGQDEKKTKKLKPNQDNAGPSHDQGNNPTTTPVGGSVVGKAGGFVYKRDRGMQGLNEVEDEDMEDMEDSEDQNMVSNEWHQVQRAKDRCFSAVVPLDYLFGTTAREKKQELEELMINNYVHCTEGPTKIKMETGDPCFKFSVETKDELEKLLEIPMEIAHPDGIVEQVMMFTRVDNSRRVSELERTVEVYGLHPRTAESRIRAALNKFGSLEQGQIATRPCTKGCKITAKVIFRN